MTEFRFTTSCGSLTVAEQVKICTGTLKASTFKKVHGSRARYASEAYRCPNRFNGFDKEGSGSDGYLVCLNLAEDNFRCKVVQAV